MNDVRRAIITWISPVEGGRDRAPAGSSYSTLAWFQDDPNWEQGMWSVVLEFDRWLAEGRLLLAQVRFLVPEAPGHLLRQGSRFMLMEGKRRVARALVLPDAIEVPDQLTAFETALVS